MSKPPKIRCAIYTRKSHEEGLDQEFNSLDAQRVAAEAYIQSQMHEGWEMISTRYDDGGFSGGTLERPALQQLMTDIKAGLVDVIIVYKVDRLSRSLTDFAKLVDIFDEYDVSFVSVTQQFNTTNSMGRLTLNILLSFAQFEREVTGERIRDKFAASKKKGMWMGGPLPLGYDVKNRKLLVNEKEAEQVRFIFQKFLEMKSVNKLKDYLNHIGYQTKQWTSSTGRERGGDFTNPIIRKLLTNKLYLGRIKHKNNVYDGEHEAIVDQALWQAVQDQIAENRVKRSNQHNQLHDILFKGKLFDKRGNRFTTTYSVRGNKRNYYYLNKKTKARISINELNGILLHGLAHLDIQSLNLSIQDISHEELRPRYLAAIDGITRQAVTKIVLADNRITVMLDKEALLNAVTATRAVPLAIPDRNEHIAEIIKMNDQIEVVFNIAFRSHAGKKIAYSPNGQAVNLQKTNHDESLIQAIGRSFRWNHMLDTGEAQSVKEIAEMENIERTYVGDVMRLKYLAPEIVTMILNGTQPRTLNVSQLVRQPLPMCWQQQKQLLNIA